MTSPLVPTDFAAAVAALLAQVRALPVASAAPGQGGIHRFETVVEPMDPLLWLDSCRIGDKVYWHDRDNGPATAGVGIADDVPLTPTSSYSAIDTLAARLESSVSGVRYVGGMRFDSLQLPSEIPSDWRSFGLGQFVLPAVTVSTAGDHTVLAANCLARPESIDAVCRVLVQLVDTRPTDDAVEPVALATREDEPDFADWEDNVTTVLAAIASNRCDKAVLARRTRLTVSRPVSPWRLLRRLSEQSEHTARFGFQFAGGPTFIGATPERLYRRTGCRLESEAVAGTRPRHPDSAIDRARAHELLDSDKDLREHAIVVNSVRAHLAAVCSALEIDTEPQVIKLMRLQHLRTGVLGTLREGVTDGRLLSLMHPTPAVNGFPRTTALNLIRRLEPFDRGWYAGPVGRLGRDEADFMVAIRSALMTGSDVILFSGAGIVRGSDPAREWAEIEHKIAPYTAALGDGTI